MPHDVLGISCCQCFTVPRASAGAGMSSPSVRSSTCGRDPLELKAFGSPFHASHSSPNTLSPPVELFGVPVRHASAVQPGALQALTSCLSNLHTSSRIQDYRFSYDRRAYTSKGVSTWERSGQEAGDVEPRSQGSSPRSPPWGQPRRHSGMHGKAHMRCSIRLHSPSLLRHMLFSSVVPC